MPQDTTLLSASSLQEYRAAREAAAALRRADRGLIVVSGTDRASYLQGLLTNDVLALQPGQGCYAAYLTAQGRMITDLWVYELGDVMLLSVGIEQKDVLLAKLDQFVFSEDVQLGDVSARFASFVVIGPASAHVVSGLVPVTAGELAAMPEHGNRRAPFEDQPAIVLQVSDLGVPGYELLVEDSQASLFEAKLRQTGTPELGTVAAEALRIEGGVPRFGTDMDSETIPLEAGIESRAISLTKGCYVGQEVIIRVLHRGHGRVARKLVGIVLEGDRPAASDAPVLADNQQVGEVTSSVVSPALGRPIALAYVKRDYLAPGTTLSIDGLPAAVAALPFVAPGVRPQV
jgi:folate-binding protein YgfZ